MHIHFYNPQIHLKYKYTTSWSSFIVLESLKYLILHFLLGMLVRVLPNFIQFFPHLASFLLHLLLLLVQLVYYVLVCYQVQVLFLQVLQLVFKSAVLVSQFLVLFIHLFRHTLHFFLFYLPELYQIAIFIHVASLLVNKLQRYHPFRIWAFLQTSDNTVFHIFTIIQQTDGVATSQFFYLPQNNHYKNSKIGLIFLYEKLARSIQLGIAFLQLGCLREGKILFPFLNYHLKVYLFLYSYSNFIDIQMHSQHAIFILYKYLIQLHSIKNLECREIDRQLKFIIMSGVQRWQLASQLKFPFKLLGALGSLIIGASFGYYKSKLQSDICNQNYSEEHLKNYISEDQVNNNIDKSGKPAVIYYYQPGWIEHYHVRHGFIRCSNLGHQKADFYMVNLTKKLQKTIPQLQHKFPMDQCLMEIRFPKDKCMVTYTDNEQQQKIAYRRQFFNNTFTNSFGVQHFVQQNGIIQPKDPLKKFSNLTNNCLFSPIFQQNFDKKQQN